MKGSNMGTNRNVVLAIVIAVLVVAGIVIFVMLRNNNQAIQSADQNANNSLVANNSNMVNSNTAANANNSANTNTSVPANNANLNNANSNSSNNNSNNGNNNTPPTVKTFNVTAKNFSFSPSQITVNKGDTVKIVLTSQGGTHDWVVDQFNAKTSLVSDGQTATVQFVANKAGTYEYYCSVGNHRQMGMVGTLTVK